MLRNVTIMSNLCGHTWEQQIWTEFFFFFIIFFLWRAVHFYACIWRLPRAHRVSFEVIKDWEIRKENNEWNLFGELLTH
jgi:hypothetical protein